LRGARGVFLSHSVCIMESRIGVQDDKLRAIYLATDSQIFLF